MSFRALIVRSYFIFRSVLTMYILLLLLIVKRPWLAVRPRDYRSFHTFAGLQLLHIFRTFVFKGLGTHHWGGEV